MPPGHILQHLPWGLWGSVLLKNIIYIWKSTTLNKMAFSKFWLDAFGGMMGVGGGYFPSNHFRLLKRALAPPISNRINPFRSFYDNSFDTKCPGTENKKINNTLCQHRSLLRQRDWAAFDNTQYTCELYKYKPWALKEASRTILNIFLKIYIH